MRRKRLHYSHRTLLSSTTIAAGAGKSATPSYNALTREVEDIEALINAAGGSAFVFGTSSGACLALEAAIKLGDKIKKLAMYEPPYNSDKTVPHAQQRTLEGQTDDVNLQVLAPVLVEFFTQ